MIALHLFTIVLVVVMILLGFWQLSRHEERATFNDAVRARAMEAPRSPNEVLALDSDVANLEWYPVIAQGTYLQDEDVLLVNVSQNGRAGVDPISALQLADGRVLVVNRGFIPLTETAPAAPRGEVTVIGRLRTTDERKRGELSDATTGELREIQRIDLERLSAQLPGPVLPFYVDLLVSTPADDPILSRVADPELTIGSHLSYTGQWWIFSLCAVIAWVFIVRRVLAPMRAAKTSA
jgi:cytochrome oxidase assembly protein ShyY1